MTISRSEEMSDLDLKRARLAELKNVGWKSAGWMIEVGVDSPEAWLKRARWKPIAA